MFVMAEGSIGRRVLLSGEFPLPVLGLFPWVIEGCLA